MSCERLKPPKVLASWLEGAECNIKENLSYQCLYEENMNISIFPYRRLELTSKEKRVNNRDQYIGENRQENKSQRKLC